MKLKIVDARKQTLTDIVFRKLAEIEEHPEVAKWDIVAHGGDVEKTFVDFKKSIENLSDTKDEFLVAFLDDTVVGFAGIHGLKGEIEETAHVGEIGISIHPDFQRQGIGTRLLKACVSLARKQGFQRLEADTLAHNISMRRILDKSGFKLEGIRQRRIRIKGKDFHEVIYAKILSAQRRT